MTSDKFTDIPKSVVYLVLAVLIYFPLFSHLSSFPIRIWDEARLANNAYEMLNNHDYIVTYHGGEPDMWNTKPPFMIWCQVICMKIFGVGEFAVRLPSALAGLFTCLAIMLLSIRYLKNYWFGFISILVLITAEGYVRGHVIRTGDYDALLTLFTTVAGLSFFAFCENQKTKWLYYFFGFTILAVLTKSITGLLFAPALLIYAIWRKQFIPLIKNKHFYFGIIAFLLIVLGYYFLREAYNPGYLDAVYENDLGGRFLDTIENHKKTGWHYYDRMMDSLFKYWFMLIPCGIGVGLFSKNLQLKRLTVFSTLMALVFLLVISSSQTKLDWYDAPLYPFLSIIVGVFIFSLFDFIKNNEAIQRGFSFNPLPVLLLFLFLVTPYRAVVQRTYIPHEYPWDKEFYEMSYYLRDGLRGVHDLNNKTVCFDGYFAHLSFYLNLLNDKGINTNIKDWTKLNNGDIVFAYQNNVIDYIKANYNAEQIDQYYNVITYRIIERKPHND